MRKLLLAVVIVLAFLTGMRCNTAQSEVEFAPVPIIETVPESVLEDEGSVRMPAPPTPAPCDVAFDCGWILET